MKRSLQKEALVVNRRASGSCVGTMEEKGDAVMEVAFLFLLAHTQLAKLS